MNSKLIFILKFRKGKKQQIFSDKWHNTKKKELF